MKSLRGHLLVASASLRDPNFFRAVVLIVRHNEEGAFGLILNRPTNARIEQVWSQVSQTPCQCEGVLHFGGPVEGPLFALHGDPAASEEELRPELHFSSDPENLELLVGEPHDPIRFYVGYAGWGAGQLERELSEGSWSTPLAEAANIFQTDQDLWQRLTREIAGNSLLSVLKIKHVPPDPSLN